MIHWCIAKLTGLGDVENADQLWKGLRTFEGTSDNCPKVFVKSLCGFGHLWDPIFPLSRRGASWGGSNRDAQEKLFKGQSIFFPIQLATEDACGVNCISSALADPNVLGGEAMYSSLRRHGVGAIVALHTLFGLCPANRDGQHTDLLAEHS